MSLSDLIDGAPVVEAPSDAPKRPHVIESVKFAPDGSSVIECSCLGFRGSPEEHRRHRGAMGLSTPGPARPKAKRVVALGPPKRRKSVQTLLFMEDL